MPLKTILVPLNGSAGDRQALEHGVDIAHRFGSHLTALLPGGQLSEIVPDPADTKAKVRHQLLLEAQRQLAQRQAEARQLFDETVRDMRTTVAEEPRRTAEATIHFEWRRGTEGAVIAEAAVLHDLILFHHDVKGNDAGQDSSSTIKSALQSSGRPLLLVPTRPSRSLAATVAIAWNGSIEGAHAVTAALPFLRDATTVHILTVETAKTSSHEGERLRRYLGWHGIEATLQPIGSAPVSVAGTLLSKATELGADLFVTGGYSHGRMRQTVLGGVTHHLLRYATLPILLSR